MVRATAAFFGGASAVFFPLYATAAALHTIASLVFHFLFLLQIISDQQHPALVTTIQTRCFVTGSLPAANVAYFC